MAEHDPSVVYKQTKSKGVIAMNFDWKKMVGIGLVLLVTFAMAADFIDSGKLDFVKVMQELVTGAVAFLAKYELTLVPAVVAFVQWVKVKLGLENGWPNVIAFVASFAVGTILQVAATVGAPITWFVWATFLFNDFSLFGMATGLFKVGEEFAETARGK